MRESRWLEARPGLTGALPLAVTLLAAMLTACATGAPSVPSAPSGPVAKLRCPMPPPCGDTCSNYPFQPTECWTTDHGPARADIVLSSKNFLLCTEGSYALCFFSGPPNATGTNSSNRALPCERIAGVGDVASCTCQVYTSGPYFVDINAILNLGAYNETVRACGQHGELCQNLHACGPSGSPHACAALRVAPVCQYVKHQNRFDPKVSLIPEADLVSTFSTAMSSNGDYQIGKTPCPPARYAGCMTAPCTFPVGAKMPPADGDPIQCQCPTFVGPYQVGQFGKPKEICEIPPSGGKVYVWSASYTVPSSDDKPSADE